MIQADGDLAMIAKIVAQRTNVSLLEVYNRLGWFYCKAWVRGRKSISFPLLYGFQTTFHHPEEAADYITGRFR